MKSGKFRFLAFLCEKIEGAPAPPREAPVPLGKSCLRGRANTGKIDAADAAAKISAPIGRANPAMPATTGGATMAGRSCRRRARHLRRPRAVRPLPRL